MAVVKFIEEDSCLLWKFHSQVTSLLFSSRILTVLRVLTQTLSKSSVSVDMESSGIVRFAVKSIIYCGPFLISTGMRNLYLPNFDVLRVYKTTLKRMDWFGITFYALSGSITIPAKFNSFLSKLKFIGIFPQLVNLNDFWTDFPTIILPKSQV